MKKLVFLVSLILVFCLALPQTTLFSDQIDLVKLKKEEEERKKKLEKEKVKVKIITNETLEEMGLGTANKNESKPKPKPKPTVKKSNDSKKKKEKKPKPDPKKTKEYWVKRKADLEKQVREFSAQAEKQQLELNRLFTEYISSNAWPRSDEVKKEMEELKGKLDFTKKKLEVAQRMLDGLDEEARKAGVPPGWVR